MLLSSLLCRLAPYRGWFPVICSLCCSNFVYFYCFHSLKANWLKGKQPSSSVDLALGVAAGKTSWPRVKTMESQSWNLPPSVCPGVVNVLVTTPLWVVNTRLKLQGSKFRSADIQPTNYDGIFGKTPVTLWNLGQRNFFFCCRWAICRHTFCFFQMRFSRLFATRVWALCGTAPSRPSCWCWTLPSSSWFMKDWRGSWRKAFPGRWATGEIKWGLGILGYVKTEKDED